MEIKEVKHESVPFYQIPDKTDIIGKKVRTTKYEVSANSNIFIWVLIIVSLIVMIFNFIF